MWRSLCGFNCDLTADIVECNRQCPSVGDCNTLQKCQNMSELRHVLVRFSAWSLDPYIIFISSIMTFSNAFIVVLLWISLLLHSRWAIDEATLWHKGEFWTSSNFTLEFIYSMSVSDKSEISLDWFGIHFVGKGEPSLPPPYVRKNSQYLALCPSLLHEKHVIGWPYLHDHSRWFPSPQNVHLSLGLNWSA